MDPYQLSTPALLTEYERAVRQTTLARYKGDPHSEVYNKGVVERELYWALRARLEGVTPPFEPGQRVRLKADHTIERSVATVYYREGLWYMLCAADAHAAMYVHPQDYEVVRPALVVVK